MGKVPGEKCDLARRDNPTIIDRIAEILKRKGMTQRELAEKIGYNETQITRWTRGFPNFTISSLAKLSEALGEPLIQINSLQGQTTTE